MTATLYHGPGAKDRSLQAADELGVLVAPPFGDSRLNVGEARQVVELVVYPQAVDKLGIIVVGLDYAAPKTQDVFLKILEEHDPSITRMLLWASDLGNVVPTVRSRCLEEWCPPIKEYETDDSLKPLLEHLRKGRTAEALQEIMSHKATPEEVLDYLSKWCLLNWDSEGSEWWAKVRPVYEKRNPTHLEVIAALMEVVR